MSTKTETLALALQHHRAGRVAQAEGLYRQIIAAGSSDPAVWCYLGTAQLALGRPRDAEASFRQALQLRPQLAEARADLGIALAQQGRMGEAADVIQQALQLRPQYPEALSNLGALFDHLDRPHDAVVCLEEALRQRADYPEAYNNLGLVFLHRGRNAEAATYFRHAIAFRPDFEQARRNLELALGPQASPPTPAPPADAARNHNVRGIELAQGGRWDEAVANFREAVRLRPDYTDAFNNLGNVLYFQGKLDEAVAAYREAVRLSPNHAGALSNLGEVLRHHGKLSEALECCQRAVELQPDFAQGRNHLGLALSSNERFDEALVQCGEAVRLQPDLAEAHHGLGYVLLQLRRIEEAIAAIETALRLKPDLAEAHANLGACLLRRGRIDEAQAQLDDALRRKPDLTDAYIHKAHALWQLGHFDEALAAGAEIVRRKPKAAEGHNVMGVVHMKAGRPAEALAAFARALEIAPDFAQAHFNRGLAYLLMGDYVHGWPEYDWRWRCRDFVSKPVRQEHMWDGSPLAGRTILLHAEQGVGDALQFLRFIPLVKQQRATVIVAGSPALMPLLSRVPGIDQVVEPGAPGVQFDVEAPLLSLPGRLGITLDTLPAQVPYLPGDADREAYWRKELSRTPGYRVGVVWQGNPDHPEDRLRSVALSTFAPLAKNGVRLISLQLGPGREQIDALAGQFAVEELPSGPDDAAPILRSAAVIKNLDLVITVDTAVAHLAGALGVPVWVALAFAPDWRWLLGREDSPWYPTARLFRQKRFGDWTGVFGRMGRELARRDQPPTSRGGAGGGT
jgi:tetratricopeptide (TPR) repeat protein